MSIPTERTFVDVGAHKFKAHLVLEPAAGAIREEIQRLSRDDHPRPRLPGPSPVSIERSNFETLQKSEYLVCEKTDGVRVIAACIRYAGVKLMVVMDRALQVYLFPLRKVPRPMFQGTILDAELAWDKLAGKFALAVFDAVVVSGVSVSHVSVYDRLIGASKALAAYAPHPDDPALVFVKSFVPLHAPALIRPFLDTISERFDVDGVILTPTRDPVVYGRHMSMFKLKTKGRHTVDFMVGKNGELQIFDSKSKRHVTKGQMMFDIPPAKTIVECSHMGNGDPDIKFWKLVTVRVDKNAANDLVTYEATMKNMRENLCLDDVLSLFERDV